MKKLAVVVVLLIFASVFCGAVSAAVTTGPAPNSGDGIPDGSGLTRPDTSGMGPAPNSGDGESDGSGFN